MPEFSNPFPGFIQRKMTQTELVRAIMLDISAELEAVHLYLAHMDATDNEDAKKVLYDVALEELVHVGEFSSVLYRIDPTAAQKAQEGFDEVAELLGSRAPLEVDSGGSEQDEQTGSSIPQGLTVGNLIGK